jgi:hypothetical protein
MLAVVQHQPFVGFVRTQQGTNPHNPIETKFIAIVSVGFIRLDRILAVDCKPIF